MIDLQDEEHVYLCGNDENNLFEAIYIKTESNILVRHKVLDGGQAKFQTVEVINEHIHYFQQ